ncbi:MAG: type IV pilin [Euryarchaeota archaeon]|nr:type IV pilin [Euryarchaeota archaeon]
MRGKRGKISRMTKDIGGVDPVVATLLLVAITVVLAAALYAVVMTYRNITSIEPIESFIGVTRPSSNTERITYGPFSVPTEFHGCKLGIDPPGEDPDSGDSENWNLADGIDDSHGSNSTIVLSIVDIAGMAESVRGITWRSPRARREFRPMNGPSRFCPGAAGTH